MSGFANLTEAQLIVAGAAAVIVVLVALISILALRGAGRSARELDGRLRQLAESQAATQALTAETLRAQERALSQAMEQRLSELSQRIGNRLSDTAQQQHTTLTNLHKRLEVIDRAQQNITQLSSQVVGLQDILANKQA
ncbi:MAG: DNA recombination protein RmuC, partial [Kiloniellales bacterium]|nr:DNA recombination protein RmuC [Kiloniellales bacterium]